MKFVAVRDFRNQSSKIWRELAEEREMVITSNGKPIAILSAVGERDLEETMSAFRQARAVRAMTDLQKGSVELGTDRLTLDEINREIDRARSKRKS